MNIFGQFVPSIHQTKSRIAFIPNSFIYYFIYVNIPSFYTIKENYNNLTLKYGQNQIPIIRTIKAAVKHKQQKHKPLKWISFFKKPAE